MKAIQRLLGFVLVVGFAAIFVACSDGLTAPLTDSGAGVSSGDQLSSAGSPDDSGGRGSDDSGRDSPEDDHVDDDGDEEDDSGRDGPGDDDGADDDGADDDDDADDDPDDDDDAGLSALRLSCQVRTGDVRSKISVDGNNLAAGEYSARVSSGDNSATSSLASTIGDEVEFDFDSDADDIAAGATSIATDFIQTSADPDVVAEILDAAGAVVVSAGAECEVRG